MKAIRSLADTDSLLHRALLTFAIALALISGLLAMHVLHAADSHVATEVSAIEDGASWTSDPRSAAAYTSQAAHCPDGCDTPAHAPEHLMLMVTCVLALLTAAAVLIPPVSLDRSIATRARTDAGLGVRRALAHPRPPSLLILSISRT